MNKNTLIAKAQSGVAWNGGIRIFHIAIQFGVTLVLVRLLEPEDYGTYAVVAGIIGFLNAVSYDNFIGHIIQVRDDKDVHAQDHFTAAVALQSMIFLAANLLAVGLSYVPGYQHVSGYIHVLAPILLLSSVGGFRYRMLERDLNWSRFRILQAIGMVLTAATMLVLGFSGAGVYALLVAPSVNYIPPIVDLLLVERWRPTWQWSLDNYRPALRFGVKRMASSALLKGRGMVEANWLVVLMGVTSLGFYNRAVGLTQMICVQFAAVVAQAVYPVLTKIEPGSEQYRKASSLVLRAIAWIVIPVAMLGAMLATPCVRLLFGEKWLPSAGLLPLTLGFGTIAAISHAAYALTLANLQEVKCLWYDGVRIAGTLVSLALWPMYGSIEGYLAGIVVVELAGLGLLLFLLYRVRAVELSGIASALFPPLVASLFAFVVVYLLVGWHPDVDMLSIPHLLTIALFAFVYSLVVRIAFRVQLDELVSRLPCSRQLNRLLLIRTPGVIG